MELEQYQCFRLKERVCKVSIHFINNEPFVFLDDIQDKFGCKIRSFNVDHRPLAFVRNHRHEREEPARIRAAINEIIDCDEPQESGFDKNLHDKVDRIGENVQKALENTELLITKTEAILRQAFELAEFTVPRLFVIVPDETCILNPTNLFRHSYRLFFLCECEEERHLAFHEGYELDQPREFIRKYGPYLKKMLTVVKCALTITSVLVPQLDKLSSKISVPDSLKDDKFWNSFGEKIEQMDDVLGEVMKDEKQGLLADISLEGADLRQIQCFLKRKDARQKLGNLFRSTTSTGSVQWVCAHHYNKFYGNKIRKNLQHTFSTLGGIVRGDEITVDEYSVKNFDEMLKVISQGLYLFKLSLCNCKVRESTFDKLLMLAGERSYIKYLELYSINVSSRIGFTSTHNEIIRKLETTVKKYPNLTIKYTIEYPKNKPGPDPDLFDYSLKQSTERLILHVYTRDDGKKIVLQDLNNSDLLRMVKSLDQCKTVTQCSIDQFNRELSNILIMNTTITSLTIFLVKFNEEKIADLKDFLSRRTCLRVLRCSTCENLSPLITMISQELISNVTLELLALNGISDDKQMTELATMLEKNNHLTELNLALDTNMNFRTIIHLSQALKVNNSLKILILTEMRSGIVQQDSSINLFELFFRKTSIEQLTLHFHSHQSKMSLFRETIQANTNIQILDLSKCNILTTKKLSGICSIIVSNSLVSLSLHSCEFSFEDAVDLFQGLIHNKTLISLSLSNLHIPISTSAISLSTELAKMLEVNTALKKLTCSHGRLGDQAVVMIGEALKSNTTLEELNISFNQIGNDGAVALGDALKINNGLLLLNVQGNDIKLDGILSIFQSLQTNVTLRHLYIPQSGFQNSREMFNKAKQDVLNVNEFISIY